MESAQVAIPAQGEGGKTATYQNVGLSLNLEALSAAGRSVRLHRSSEPGPSISATSS
jgi:hypothetical protein